METLTTQTLATMDMVKYWKGIRVGECAKRNPAVCKLIDEQIAQYEAQVEHQKEIEKGINKRVSDNTFNYVYGLKEALDMINWAELEDTNSTDEAIEV